MSYIRWGQEGSSVYVIGVGDETTCDYLLCVQCDRGVSFVARTPADMIAHLLAHRERGDTVPDIAIERLKEECEL